jgi:hypothetical protein
MVSDNCAKLAGLDLNHEYTESGDEEAEDKWHILCSLIKHQGPEFLVIKRMVSGQILLF